MTSVNFDSFDPGVKYFAWAHWTQGALTACGLYRDSPYYWRPTIGVAVIECPVRKFDADTREKDIFDLARAAGEIGSRYRERIYVSPSKWKGQVPKGIHQEHHILPKLTPGEHTLLPKKKTELKHVLDAIGIGLWYLGR